MVSFTVLAPTVVATAAAGAGGVGGRLLQENGAAAAAVAPGAVAPAAMDEGANACHRCPRHVLRQPVSQRKVAAARFLALLAAAVGAFVPAAAAPAAAALAGPVGVFEFSGCHGRLRTVISIRSEVAAPAAASAWLAPAQRRRPGVPHEPACIRGSTAHVIR